MLKDLRTATYAEVKQSKEGSPVSKPSGGQRIEMADKEHECALTEATHMNRQSITPRFCFATIVVRAAQKMSFLRSRHGFRASSNQYLCY